MLVLAAVIDHNLNQSEARPGRHRVRGWTHHAVPAGERHHRTRGSREMTLSRLEVNCGANLRDPRIQHVLRGQPRRRDGAVDWVVGQHSRDVQQVVEIDRSFVRVRPILTSFARRRSSWLTRSPYYVPGSIRLTVTFATPPDGGRPSDCATTAAGRCSSPPIALPDCCGTSC